ncbi:MAG: potassium channel protein [candidate division WOR-3 bacterium]
MLCFGIVGYMIIEGWGFLDSLYQTVITVSTVGFEVYPLSDAGRIFTIVLLILAISFVAYSASQFVSFIVEGRLNEFFSKRRMKKLLSELRDHFIVCGYGRMGALVANNLRSEGQSLVVIDDDPEMVRKATEEGFLAIEGDATQEEVLKRAGIERAKAVAAVLRDEPQNLYLTITAKALNPSARVVAKALTEEGKARLEKVGADTVILIYNIGGDRLSLALLRPEDLDFVYIAHGAGKHIVIGETRLPPNCRILGKTVGKAGLKEQYGIDLLLIKRENNIILPGPSDTLAEGDMLFLMGEREQVMRFLRDRL